ncbi:nicotinate-nucleotide pyrophosphorylase [carboxylating] [Ectothiorhodosinus mongolicus]|uniref:Probable nicotinate-nucleotide pyrophosphorylase [carboxylating] n=1 Tax=Ectothiorhodosinus mongolicus TaxID=233100 RepID=A0A1R3VPJ3_9GAMM|nr:carboxylating nicotinate-nucleotide diphosphorylase [Ectothiorhodosinus mongolicus]ULX56624.1 carboxylating nicotinate-nucleotide diphosphorylase [Ectothiorhodosinus mongolicus]SIT66550.1 nicotinate-nucleotide pyrophosphorylase [carboxylating] [Ectothiorhodosinus mongolicus]
MTSLPDPEHIAAQVRAALAEDIGTGDITAALIDDRTQCQAQVISRESAIICGQAWFDLAFQQLDPNIHIHWAVAEGARVTPDQSLCQLTGSARAVLTAERTGLNFLQTLSATATVTRRYVDVISGTQATILDTRKTLPGMRLAQKYAVRVGGGQNHRLGLYDAFLIKENHIMAAGGIAGAIAKARQLSPGKPIEVETENFSEVQQALEAGADVIMLDDFSLEQMREAVAWVAGRCRLEASGGATLETVRALALTGVDYISVGALTKHIQAIDLSLRLEKPV